VARVEFRVLPATTGSIAEHAEACFQAVFAALRERLSEERRIAVLAPEAVAEAVTGSLAALLRTARQEHPRISGSVIRYPST